MSNAEKNKQLSVISNQFAQIENELKGSLTAEKVGLIEFELKVARQKIAVFKNQFGPNDYHVNKFENMADKLSSTLKGSAFNCI